MIAALLTVAVFGLGAAIAAAGPLPLPGGETLRPIGALTAAVTLGCLAAGVSPVPLLATVAVGVLGGIVGHRARWAGSLLPVRRSTAV